MKILSPLRVKVSAEKHFILNLNNYRNAHYHTLNKAKVVYKELMLPILVGSINTPVSITYTLYPKSKRRTDIGNVLSIHQKFFEDVLVEGGYIPDDSYQHIPKILYLFGEVDPTNPRVEIVIEELQ